MSKLQILSISITNKCNLNCVYCGRNNFSVAKKEVSIGNIINAIEGAIPLGLHTVNVTGGEVLCREDIYDLFEFIIKKNLKLSIESNGTLIDSTVIEKFEQYGENFSLSISLDGIHSKTHDLTRGKGSYNKAISAIKLVSKSKIKNARVITVLSNNNYYEIRELAETIYNNYNLGFRLLPDIIEYGKGKEAHNSYGVEYSKVKKLVDEFYFDFMKQDPKKITIELPVALMPLEFEDQAKCSWGEAMLGIDSFGNIGLCHVSCNDECFKFGNINADKIQDIWFKNKKLKKFQELDPNRLKGVCGKCIAREWCRGGCRVYAISKYGDFYAPDPQCQNIFEIGEFPSFALENEEC